MSQDNIYALVIGLLAGLVIMDLMLKLIDFGLHRRNRVKRTKFMYLNLHHDMVAGKYVVMETVYVDKDGEHVNIQVGRRIGVADGAA